MRRTNLIAAGLAMLLLLPAAPAFAGYGAVAYDQNSGKYGVSWDQKTQARADELALKQCGSPGCRVHAVEPAGCGALALGNEEAGHIPRGGADRETLDAAKRDAVAHCQTHTKDGTCTVRVSGCNQ